MSPLQSCLSFLSKQNKISKGIEWEHHCFKKGDVEYQERKREAPVTENERSATIKRLQVRASDRCREY